MTEQEWLTCTDPNAMLNFLGGKASNRKLRLFACACGRQVWHSLTDERWRKAVETAERFADGLASLIALEIDCEEAWDHIDFGEGPITTAHIAVAIMAEPKSEAFAVRDMLTCGEVLIDPCGLLRDIIGNPFRPVPPDPALLAWNDGTIPKLAQTIYDERAFDRFPILADALEEAGCDNADILNHCRQPGEHVRGCWMVDLLLGKS